MPHEPLSWGCPEILAHPVFCYEPRIIERIALNRGQFLIHDKLFSRDWLKCITWTAVNFERCSEYFVDLNLRSNLLILEFQAHRIDVRGIVSCNPWTVACTRFISRHVWFNSIWRWRLRDKRRFAQLDLIVWTGFDSILNCWINWIKNIDRWNSHSVQKPLESFGTHLLNKANCFHFSDFIPRCVWHFVWFSVICVIWRQKSVIWLIRHRQIIFFCPVLAWPIRIGVERICSRCTFPTEGDCRSNRQFFKESVQVSPGCCGCEL
jgi:hypothetical protein